VQFNNNSKFFHEENWIILESVHSTNTYAKEILSNSRPFVDGTLILAHEQVAGRGQNQNTWVSEPGKNLTFSFILDIRFLSLKRQFQLNQTICLGILDFLHSMGFDDSRIKWPNDLYIGEKKVGGILIENIISGNQHKYSVVGIGLNINQTEFPKGLSRAVSFKSLKGLEYDKMEILKNLLKSLEFRLFQLGRSEFLGIEEDFQNSLFGKGQLRYFRDEENSFQGIIQGTSTEGKLILKIGEQEKKFDHHEVFFVF